MVNSYLVTIVSPTSELHLTVLVVKWKPSNVNFTGGLKYAGRDVSQCSGISDHNLYRVGAIEGLIGTETDQSTSIRGHF